MSKLFNYENGKRLNPIVKIADNDITVEHPNIESFKRNYDIELRIFLSRNIGKKEIDFLKKQIGHYKSEIDRINQITDAEIKKFVLPEVQGEIEYEEMTIEKRNDWIDLEVEIRRGWVNRNIVNCNFHILEYTIRLERLSEKEKIKIESSNRKSISNNHSRIFINSDTFELFLDYIKNHIIEPYVDYSYLFQRLLDENLIHGIKHRSFMMWLKDEKYVSEVTFDSFLQKESFRTLQKCFSIQRENNFNNIFKSNTSP